MTSLTFFGGVNEIGGNKILLEDRETRIWLDFGMSFSRYGMYFEEFMGPRTKAGLKDFLTLHLTPDIQGLYAPDLLELAGLREQRPQFDAVLISHPHEDHVKYVSFLHPEIPVYMSEACYAICQKLEEIGTSTIDNRICAYQERDPESGRSQGSKIKREIKTFKHGQLFKVGAIEIVPYEVDHSIPGAFAFVIYTSAGPLVYTGDVRLHGRNGFKTEDFMNSAAKEKPIALITEGTRVTDVKKLTESEVSVKQKIKRHAVETPGLVVVDYAFKDADRFRTLVQVAHECGRKLIISTKAAALYELYAQLEDIKTPSITDENLLIHVKKKTSPNVWERRFYEMPNAIDAEAIGKCQSDFLLGLNQWALNELIDVEPREALYVRSLSEPYNEEMALGEERVDNWIDFYQMKKIRAHCSGHAPGVDILAIAACIRAQQIFPIHTEHPEAFRGLAPQFNLVEAGKRFSV